MKKLFACLLSGLLTLASLSSLAACTTLDKTPRVYSDSDYSVGDAVIENAVVDIVHIYWIDGDVNVKMHEKNTIEISETSAKELNDDQFKVHYKYRAPTKATDTGTLFVYYVASGDFDVSGYDKDVTILIPKVEGIYLGGHSDSANFHVDFDDVENTAQTIILNTLTGNFDVQVDAASEIQLGGQNNEDLMKNLKGHCNVDAKGRIRLLGIQMWFTSSTINAAKIDALEGVGGKNPAIINVGELGTFERKSGLFDVKLSLKKFGKIKLGDLRGKAVLAFPLDLDFTLKIGASVGFAYQDFELEKSSENTYTNGKGGAEIGIACQEYYKASVELIPLEA